MEMADEEGGGWWNLHRKQGTDLLCQGICPKAAGEGQAWEQGPVFLTPEYGL